MQGPKGFRCGTTFVSNVWRSARGAEAGYTYFYTGGPARLDRFYSNPELIDCIAKMFNLPTDLTDHLCVSVEVFHEMTSKEFRFNNNLWKMNTEILKEEIFQQNFYEFWTSANALASRKNNITQWWEEIFKPKLKLMAVRYGKFRAAEKRAKREELNDQLIKITNLLNKGEGEYDKFLEVKRGLRDWEKEVAKGCKIRAGKVMDEKEERTSTFHMNSERKRIVNREITKLEVDGRVVVEGKGIAQGILKHFESVFQRAGDVELSDREDFLGEVKGMLKKEEYVLDGELTLEELQFVLEKTKKDKSPGVDGIPYEFYLTSFKTIGSTMVEMMNATMRAKRLAKSQGLAVVKLIPKKKNAQRPSDFRPISLLCTDYKLLAGILAERLKETLPGTVGESQRGGVPRRKFFNSLTLYRERVNELKGRGGRIGAALVAIDLEKAYDYVDRNALWTIMDEMGYSRQFIDKLRTLYNACDIQIMNGNDVCGTITGSNSVRQGCPLSVHLFVLFLEPLIAKLESCLRGLNVGNTYLKVQAYVDDLTVVVNNEKEIEIMGNCIDMFCRCFRASISKTKSLIMGLGDWEGREEWPLSWLLACDELKITGINFTPALKQTTEKNWNRVYDQIQGILTKHAARNMTIQQRSSFIKTYCLSKAIYIAKVLECPKSMARKILSKTQQFLWRGQLERPKKAASYEERLKGGLDYRNPQLFFQALLTKTFIEDLYGNETIGKELLQYWTYWKAKELKLPTGPWRNSAKSSYDPPTHIGNLLQMVQELSNQGIVDLTGKIDHKQIYQHWIQPLKEGSRMERKLPSFNWKQIWKSISNLPDRLQQQMFLLNHRLLTTQVRKKRIDPKVCMSVL